MDEISVKNLEVFCHHGVYKEENVLGQKFLVDIISKVDTREAGKTDELALSVSYGDICRCVKKEMTKQNDKLLERVAERLAECILLQFPQINEVAQFSVIVISHGKAMGASINAYGLCFR